MPNYFPEIDPVTGEFLSPLVQDAIDARAAAAGSVGHNHDDRYYTETETDALLEGKADAADGITSAERTKLAGVAAGAEPNVQADWNAATGDAQILNKPVLGTAASAAVSDFASAAQGVKADSAVRYEALQSLPAIDRVRARRNISAAGAVRASNNLVNLEEVHANSLLSGTAGKGIIAFSGYQVSGPMAVTPGQTVWYNGRHLYWYTATDALLEATSVNNTSYVMLSAVVPAGAAYMRTDWLDSKALTIQVNLDTQKPYDPYAVSVPGLSTLGIVDVKTRGAIGDGVAADYQAINNACTVVPGTGGILWLPPGRFTLSNSLSLIKQGTVIMGAGPDATVLVLGSSSTSAFKVTASDVMVANLTVEGLGSNGLLVDIPRASALHHKNWRFENVRFKGVGVALTNLAALKSDGSLFSSGSDLAQYVEFDHCEFTGATVNALEFRGVHHVTVNRGWFHDSGTDVNVGEGIKIQSGATYWRVLHCDFRSITRDAIDAFDAYRGRIEGGTMIGIGAHAIEMKENASGLTNPVDRNSIMGVTIANTGQAAATVPAIQASMGHASVSHCLIENAPAAGIRSGVLGGPTPVAPVITNNRVLSSGQGFVISGTTNAILIGNVAAGCTGAGFAVPAAQNVGLKGIDLNQSFNNGAADQMMT